MWISPHSLVPHKGAVNICRVCFINSLRRGGKKNTHLFHTEKLHHKVMTYKITERKSMVRWSQTSAVEFLGSDNTELSLSSICVQKLSSRPRERA